MRVLAAIGLSCLAGLACPALATDAFDRDDALALSQGVVGSPIGSHTLRDTRGQVFELDTLRGKPLVVSLVYTSCHHVCPLITANIRRNVDIARDALGDDAFSVVTIGFDWRNDTPERMRLYAASRSIDTPGWHFLSGDDASIDALSQALGFQYFAAPQGFDHLSQTTIVDANGIIYRQVYGEDFGAQQFVEPLKDLVFDTPRDAGLVEHWVDTFKLFCTVYDPNTGRYDFDYSIFMAIIVGALCLGAILGFIVIEWRRAR